MILRNIVQGEFCPKNISQVNLIIDIAIAEQGYGNETQHGHYAMNDGMGARRGQTPRPDTHEQGCCPSVDTHQGIAQSTGEEDIGCTKTSLLWNTLNAKLPEISGSTPNGSYFSLKEIDIDNRISEAEFNINADFEKLEKDILKNYCNGFMDLVFRRIIPETGKEVYCVLDWKSDFFEGKHYSNGKELASHTNNRYSIQRVLYSYSLVKWLCSFYTDESEEEDRKCELCKDKANNICFDCSFYLCDNCFEYLHNNKVNSEHKKEEIEPLISIDFKCREHPIVPMNLFCIKENSKIYIYIIFK